ncbi:hypothetical protein BKA70DRAFT_74217 [Coprinopsis sp. MPI-PUGE-AT-0042]|nr:hypothetical protein BKA70DRAFT_74217 [Coprinopsis sp. MPI-PUGE-AT-0042]
MGKFSCPWSMLCPRATYTAISTLQNVMYLFSFPSAKPASPCSAQESSSSRGFPRIAAFASALGCGTFSYPPPPCRTVYDSHGIDLSFSLFAFAPDTGIKSFGIYVSDIIHPDAQQAVEEPRMGQTRLFKWFAEGGECGRCSGAYRSTPKRNHLAMCVTERLLPSLRRGLSHSILLPLLGPLVQASPQNTTTSSLIRQGISISRPVLSKQRCGPRHPQTSTRLLRRFSPQ